MKEEIKSVKSITLKIDDNLRLAARIKALKEGKSLSDVIRELLKKYVQE